jgi:hypothetical protein
VNYSLSRRYTEQDGCLHDSHYVYACLAAAVRLIFGLYLQAAKVQGKSKFGRSKSHECAKCKHVGVHYLKSDQSGVRGSTLKDVCVGKRTNYNIFLTHLIS